MIWLMNKLEMELKPDKKAFDSNTTLRSPLDFSPRATHQRVEISNERICGVYFAQGEMNRRKDSRSSRKEQMLVGRLRICLHWDLKYWLHKIRRALDAICRKYAVWEETAELTAYDCPRISHPPHEQTPLDALAKDP